jgi:hypothetical protein
VSTLERVSYRMVDSITDYTSSIWLQKTNKMTV